MCIISYVIIDDRMTIKTSVGALNNIIFKYFLIQLLGPLFKVFDLNFIYLKITTNLLKIN